MSDFMHWLYASHAFLLGLRTGAGLVYSSQNSFGSTQPSI